MIARRLSTKINQQNQLFTRKAINNDVINYSRRSVYSSNHHYVSTKLYMVASVDDDNNDENENCKTIESTWNIQGLKKRS